MIHPNSGSYEVLSFDVDRRIKILFVDDEPGVLELAKIFLEKIDNRLQVEPASSAEDALKLSAKKDFDIIVSDYQMPDIDGLQFLKIVRKERGSDIPFMVFTGKGREAVAMKALNLGADRYLRKGGDPESQYGVLAQAIIQEVEHRRAARALREKETTLRSIHRAAPIGIGLVTDRILKWTNEMLSEMTGYSKDELIGRSARMIYPSDDEYERVGTEKYAQIEERGVGTVETRWKRKDGQVINILLSSTPLNQEDPSSGVIFTALDISDRKRAERSLQESEEELAAIYENAPAIMVLVDEERRIRKANSSAEEFSNLSVDEMIGKRGGGEALRCAHHLDDPKGCGFGPYCEDCTVRRSVMDTMRTGRSHHQVEAVLPVMGDDTEEERTLLISTVLLEHKEKPLVLLSIEDITDIKKKENILRETNRRLSTLFKNLPGISYRCRNDRNWTMEFMSDACRELTGYEAEEMIQNAEVPYGEIIHPEDREYLWEEIQGAVEREAPFKIEYRIITSSGEEKWVWEQGRAVEAENGVEILEGIIMDITEYKENEIELRESKRLFNAIFEDQNSFIGLLNPEGNLLKANETSMDFIGSSIRDLRDLPFWKTPWWTHSEELQQRLKRGIERASKGEVVRFEVTHCGEGGDMVAVDFSLRPVYDEEDEVVGLIAEGRNIDGLKEIEEELRTERDVFKKYLDTAEVIMITINAEGAVIQANRKAIDVLGYDRDEIIGMDWFENFVLGNEREEFQQFLSNNIFNEENWPEYFETQVLTKENEKRIIRWRTSLLKDEGGEILGLLGAGIDITEQKEIEEELAFRNQMLSSILDSASDMIYFKDKQSRFVEVSKAYADRMDSTPEEMRKRTVFDLFPEEQARQMIESDRKVMETGTPIRNSEEKFTWKDGRDVWISTTKVPWYDDGEVVGTIGISREITDRKEAEQRGELLHSLLRHDVKNKVQIVEGYLELANDYALPNEVRGYIEKAKRASHEGQKIIEKVQTLRKIREEMVGRVKVDSMVNEVVEENRDRASEKGLVLDIECVPSREVKGGPLLKELFGNLINNSIMHSGGSVIRIRVEDSDDGVVCVIEDDGAGIPQKKRQQIFERGFRGTSSKGSGMGLYLAKEIAESYGGKVEVKGSMMGGARFDVYLQRA